MQKARGNHCIKKKILTDIPSISSSWELLQTNLNDWKQGERDSGLHSVGDLQFWYVIKQAEFEKFCEQHIHVDYTNLIREPTSNLKSILVIVYPRLLIYHCHLWMFKLQFQWLIVSRREMPKLKTFCLLLLRFFFIFIAVTIHLLWSFQGNNECRLSFCWNRVTSWSGGWISWPRNCCYYVFGRGKGEFGVRRKVRRLDSLYSSCKRHDEPQASRYEAVSSGCWYSCLEKKDLFYRTHKW